jgi:hypothetical protein
VGDGLGARAGAIWFPGASRIVVAAELALFKRRSSNETHSKHASISEHAVRTLHHSNFHIASPPTAEGPFQRPLLDRFSAVGEAKVSAERGLVTWLHLISAASLAVIRPF